MVAGFGREEPSSSTQKLVAMDSPGTSVKIIKTRHVSNPMADPLFKSPIDYSFFARKGARGAAQSGKGMLGTTVQSEVSRLSLVAAMPLDVSP